MATKSRITINLDEHNYQELIELSNELDVSLAWLGRKAFTDLLAKYRRDGKNSFQAKQGIVKGDCYV